MKILLGMPSKDSWGGVVVTETPFVEALKKINPEIVEEVYVYGDKEKPTPFWARVGRVLKTAFRFRKVLRKTDFDIIHLNSAFDLKAILRDSFSLFLMNPRRGKIFLKLHGTSAKDFLETNFFVSFLINYLKKRVDGFGIHSLEELESFKALGFDEKKFYLEKNAVVIHEELPPSFSRQIKQSSEIFELLFISRFIPTKGALETIRAGAVLRDKNVKFILHCIGDGEIKAEVKREIEKLNLQEYVKLPGYVSLDELESYFFKTDIFVFPTRHDEGFPMVLFKAATVGMPIVTTKIRAGAVYLREPENCLFSTQAPESIADRIIQLIEDKELRAAMSQNNLALGKTLSPANIAKDFLEIYQKVIDG